MNSPCLFFAAGVSVHHLSLQSWKWSLQIQIAHLLQSFNLFMFYVFIIYVWKNKFMNVLYLWQERWMKMENRLSFDWRICTVDWRLQLLANTLTVLVYSQPALSFVKFRTAMVFTSPCFDSGYSPPAWLPVEWQILTKMQSLVLDSRRPLLADGSNWNITCGIQVFPSLTVGSWCVCVCVCGGYLGRHSNSEQWLMSPGEVYPCPAE